VDQISYVSGFLLNPKKNQILLIKPPQDQTSWSLMGCDGLSGEDMQDCFTQMVNKLLNVTLKTKNIYPIYDYFNESMKKTNYVFYAVVNQSFTFDPPKDSTLSWVSFDEANKFAFEPHIQQDVIVGKRVIDAQNRVASELKNPPPSF
jgi:ADP-ribose pyrophosphatase YjhB (NUDIX family)